MPHKSQATLLSDAKDLGEIRTGHPQRGRQMQMGRLKSATRLSTNNWL